MSQIYVSEIQLSSWIEEHFERACSGPVSVPATAAAVGCGILKIKTMLKTGDLSLARWQRYGEAVEGRSLLDYISKSKSPSV